jgi:hypothetical protein
VLEWTASGDGLLSAEVLGTTFSDPGNPSFALQQWRLVTLTVAGDTLTFTVTNSDAVDTTNAVTTDAQALQLFYDSASNIRTVGARPIDQNTYTTHLKTFVWEICLYNTSPPTTPNLYQIMPKQTGCATCTNECLINCNADKAWDEDTCKCVNCTGQTTCDSACIDDSCKVCVDPLCVVCNVWETCTECIATADLSNGACTCKADTYQSGADCIQCNDACTRCEDSTQHNCTACAPGYYLLPDSRTCWEECPTLFTTESRTNPDTDVCQQPLPDATSLVFTFDKNYAATYSD